MNKFFLSLLTLVLLPLYTNAKVKVPKGGKAISNELIGIFFEDISSSADGGLFSELLQNGSFEFNTTERDGWGPGTAWQFQRPGHSLGNMDFLKGAGALHPNNPTYMRVMIERVGHFKDFNGWTGVGLSNRGFDGISLKAGAAYDFSVFLRKVACQDMKVRIVLDNGNRKDLKILSDTTITLSGDGWQKYSAVLVPTQDCSHARLQMLFLERGTVDVDMVSLMPQDTYKGHGLRRDLAEALEALHPKFLRFPGGCVVHGGGDGFWNTYRWKTTIGPREQRRALKNTWGYHQSMGLGYQEYFQLCEDMHMEPLPILPCGVSCQGTNGGWGLHPDQAQEVCPMEDMEEWTQDALDLIEWANGDETTHWGRVRIENGHPAPFNLKYLGIGNEEKITPGFAERFKYMYERIRKAYPDIVIVGTAGPGSHPGNSDYRNGWKLADEIQLDIIDEHYYEKNNYFLTSRQYDKYPRDRHTKVYLGEYASKDKKLIDALAEALYLLHVERNADVVVMTSYAPLFARKGATNWNPNLIYFDNENVVLTCSYYVQQMFGLSSGDYYYGDCLKFQPSDVKENLLGQSLVLDSQKGVLYLKYANASDQDQKLDIDLSRFNVKSKATLMRIKGNLEDENNFDSHPIAPITGEITIKKRMTLDVPAHSFSLITIKL